MERLIFKILLFITLWCCLVGCCLVVPSRAQSAELRFKRFASEQRISQNNVRCMIQDNQGFIWLGTENGLVKYDSYKFTIYKPDARKPNSLSNKVINTLFQDSSNNIWIGTEDGLNRYDIKTEQFTVYRANATNPNSISDNMINDICRDRQGQLWIATGRGLNRYNPTTQTFTHYFNEPNNPTSLSNDAVSCVYEDRDDNIWLGTENGLNRYDPKTKSFIVYRSEGSEGLTSNLITTIYQDKTGEFWLGTGNGLNRYNPKTKSIKRYQHEANNSHSLSNNYITNIYEDSLGRIWIGTRMGLNIYDETTNQFIGYYNNPNDPYSLCSSNIWSIYEDTSNTLWVGTEYGVNRHYDHSQKFHIYHHDPNNSNSLSHNSIWSVYQDHEGLLWLGTENGINCYDPQKEKYVLYQHQANDPKSLSAGYIFAINEDAQGNLWIGTAEGLNLYNRANHTFTVYRSDPADPQTLSNNFITYIYNDRQGQLWVGTYNGLNLYNSKTNQFTRYNYSPSQPKSSLINAVCQAKDNGLWIATADGLTKWMPATGQVIVYKTNLDNPNSLISNYVRTLYEDAQGTLWIGTDEGLDSFNPQSQKFTHWTEKEGMPGHLIHGILPDDKGNLWISTNNGLAKLNPSTKTVRKYDTNDGLSTNDFNQYAFYRNNRGEMFFGSVNGLVTFKPDEIKDYELTIPNVVITDLRILDKPTNKAIPLLAGAVKDMELTLSYKENFLTFEFAVLDYVQPESNQYAYKLEGIDEDWVYNTHNYVSYNSLAPGHYTFRVKGANKLGIWNDNGSAIHVTILPPPWKTWWAYLCYTLLVAGISYAGVQYRLNHLRQRLLAEKNTELELKNRELDRKNQALEEAYQSANIIFSALAEVLPGMIINKLYRLDEKIGAGGFGAVYRATRLTDRQAVAVKIFRPSPSNKSFDNLRRFQREAISTLLVDHPNVVTVLDSGVSSEGILYIVMELLEGHTLAAEIEYYGKLSLGRSAQILLPVCDVLTKAHETGVIHRDIKPDNIFLHSGPQGEIIKVVDFGIAKLLEEKQTGSEPAENKVTITGELIGTPIYVSPERFAGNPYDGKADIYSLGVVIYEMLCGKTPWATAENNFRKMALIYLSQEPRQLKDLNTDIPDAINSLVMRTLDKDPSKRPSAKELSEGFTKFLDLEFQLSNQGRIALKSIDGEEYDPNATQKGHTGALPEIKPVNSLS